METSLTSLLSAFSQGVIAGEGNASLPACQPACIQSCPHSKKFIVLQAPARERRRLQNCLPLMIGVTIKESGGGPCF